MNCNEAFEFLSAALDAELSPAQQAQLDQHLAQCPACRALQAELLGLEEALGTLDVPAPAGLKDQIMENLPPQQSKGHVIYWRRWGAMAAAAAVVLLGAWQLPRFALEPKGVDSTEMAAYDAPAMDAAVQAPRNSEAVPTALNDEALLPPYVETDGVDVNAAMPTFQPDPNGADYTSYGFSPDSTPVEAPQTTPAPAEPAAPRSSRKLYTAPATGSDTAQTGGSLSESSAADQVAGEAEGESADKVPTLLFRSYPDAENGIDPPAPEATPEIAMFTAAPVGGAFVDLGEPTEGVPESSENALVSSEAPVDALAKTADPFASYCGVLTLEEYEPVDQEFTVEFSEEGLRQYILSAGDFHALVERLDSQGLPYELTTEGEGVDPEAPYGLVVVEEQTPEAAVETP